VTAGYFIGETGPELAEVLAEKGRPSRVFKTLVEAVNAAHRDAAASGSRAAVLFSPGFASFDMFKSYAERGIVFEQSVFALRGVNAPKSR
jgi:UDP-N-acetylmuramoylalanine--D-glutamate ligase